MDFLATPRDAVKSLQAAQKARSKGTSSHKIHSHKLSYPYYVHTNSLTLIHSSYLPVELKFAWSFRSDRMIECRKSVPMRFLSHPIPKSHSLMRSRALTYKRTYQSAHSHTRLSLSHPLTHSGYRKRAQFWQQPQFRRGTPSPPNHP